MLEAVDRFRRLATAKHEFRLLELGECMLQCGLVASSHGAQQGIGEVAPDGGADLPNLLHRRQAVEPRHQRVLKGCRYRQRRQWPIEPIALSVLNKDARFQNRLGEFLDEQGVPVGLGDDLLHHFGRQHATASHLRDHAFNFVLVEATEAQDADVGETSPGRLELRSEGKQCKDW